MADDAHAARMEAIYRVQRHVYDLTRKYYLLGRDRLIGGLGVPYGGGVLEVGCGTGRNLALVGRRYRSASLYGLDISAEMLKSARRNLAHAGVDGRAILAQADATAFDPLILFG
ncbi:MAG TPA: class I SAM-dependent methyltransferase, partial [Sphingobium sp.]|nr:class I SAM-dependent methyltransferase [Sphingobium sp.]